MTTFEGMQNRFINSKWFTLVPIAAMIHASYIAYQAIFVYGGDLVKGLFMAIPAILAYIIWPYVLWRIHERKKAFRQAVGQ